MATITSVETSPELDHARIYITSLGEPEEKEEVLAGLRSAAPFIRGQLGKRLHMRRIPELHFEIDRQLENAMRIESLLREALPDGPSPDETSIDPPSDDGEGGPAQGRDPRE
jgi:ribosome-binding factor A